MIEQEAYRQSPQGTTLVVAPQAFGIGAEIQGVDVAAGLSTEATRQLKGALHRYGVVVMRGQHLQPEQQVQLAKRLGEPRVSFYNRYAVPGHPELSVVSNIVEAGQAIGIADAGMLWHTDASYLKTPDLYTVLYGIEIPQKDGKVLGDTLFASSWLAYESLPEDVRVRIANLRAVHSFSWHLERKRQRGQLKRAPLTPEQRAATPDVDHPVVRRHPVTGRPCLFVTEGHTASIAGLPEAEGQKLLDRLIAHATRPEFIYRHSWKPGDLIIWDNCLVQHLAVFDYGDIPRRLHRSGIAGPVPV